MPWAPTILEQFQIVNPFTTDQSEYHGPYNTLLTDLFPHSEYYSVVPQFKITSDYMDVTTIYTVRKRKSPVFFLEIKPPKHLDVIGTRAKADQQMREQFGKILDRNLVVPKLYGISAMGTLFSVYEYDRETRALSPHFIAPSTHFLNDLAPVSRWNFDLLDDIGEQKFKDLVSDVKHMCQNIE